MVSVRASGIIIPLFIGVALVQILQGTPVANAQEPNKAAVIVRFEDGTTLSRCVAFEEEEISGLDLLQHSDLSTEIEYQGMGALVCSIDGTGCGTNDCLCQCKGGESCIYWSYWQHREDTWNYSQVGASSVNVRAGSVDGWSWGPGSPSEAIEPPTLAFDDICLLDSTVSKPTGDVQPTAEANLAPYLAFGLLIVVLAVGAVAVGRRRSET